MTKLSITEEQDIEHLRKVAQVLETQVRHLVSENAKLNRQLADAKGQTADALQLKMDTVTSQLDNAKQKIFGRSSERRHRGQPKQNVRRPRTQFGATHQTELVHVDELHSLGDDEQVCPDCGGDLEAWDGQTEDSELIDVVDVEYTVRKVRRQKYRCACPECDRIETAEGPQRLVKGGRYSIDFAIHTATEKYLNHMPLERQTRNMRRLGLKVRSQTLWNQLKTLQTYVEPTWEALRAEILTAPVIGLDQTTWKNLTKSEKKHWQIWCLTTPDSVYYTIRDDKSAKSMTDILGDYSGVVVCDALSSHGTAARGSPSYDLAYCWAHVRRYFQTAAKNFGAEADPILDLIAQLYMNERKAPLGSTELARIRHEESRPIVTEIFGKIGRIQTISTLDLGKAVTYATNQRAGLERYLGDPNIWIDNNPTERALRGAVVGRKNHYGSKSKLGTIAAATYYSLVETSKLRDRDPAEWMREIVNAAQQDPNAIVMP